MLLFFFFFFFNDTATTEIYTLSLHDALPTTHAIARTCTHTPPARSPVRWRQAAASTHRDSPTAGTAPTACSARSTQGASPDEGPTNCRERACLHADTPRNAGILRTLARDRGCAIVKVLMVSW